MLDMLTARCIREGWSAERTQHEINELKTQLTTKNAEVEDLQAKVKHLQADLVNVINATSAVLLSPTGQIAGMLVSFFVSKSCRRL